jgi:hypothetical protein
VSAIFCAWKRYIQVWSIVAVLWKNCSASTFLGNNIYL